MVCAAQSCVLLRAIILFTSAWPGQTVVQTQEVLHQSATIGPSGVDIFSVQTASLAKSAARGQMFFQQQATKSKLSDAAVLSHALKASPEVGETPVDPGSQADEQQTPGELQTPPSQATSSGKAEQASWWTRVLLQVLFGVIYYYAIVVKFPVMEPDFEPNEDAREHQEMNAISATLRAGFPNCLLSFCCTGPRAAHTLATTGILNYWAGLLAMTFFPCCTLWITNSFSDLNKQLGGTRKDCCSGCLCAFCCSCCVVAQDAESLDLAMKCKTQLCGVTDKDGTAFRAAQGDQTIVA